MHSRSQCRNLLLAVAGLQLAACSAHTDVASRSPAGAVAPVHARAAQRIELPVADGAAAPDANAPDANASGAGAALSVGARIRPAAPEMLHSPDGTVGIKVAQQYYHTIVACRLPDGTFTIDCPPGAEPRP